MTRHLTYANVASSLALAIAIGGGTAYALDGQNTVFSDDLVNGEVKIADIGQAAIGADELAANSVAAGKIIDAEVKAAEIATGAVRTEELANGQVEAEDLAPSVAPGASGARAWGLVHSDGTVLRSKNVTAVTHPVAGVYCIDPGSGIDPDTAVMVVGQDNAFGFTSAAFDDVSHAEWDSTPADCPAGTMEVQTFFGNGTPQSGGETDFGGFALSAANAGFTFVIP